MQTIIPYLRLMRLHQPAGFWLLFWPCAWGVALASDGWPDPLLLLFFIGSVVMRGVGCAINDIVDREIDAQVERTKARPIASGQVTPKQALFFIGCLMAGGGMILLLLPPAVWLWALASLPLIVAYPFMKRITWWPQLFLGLTFNWGAVGSSRVDLQACKLEYSIVSPK